MQKFYKLIISLAVLASLICLFSVVAHADEIKTATVTADSLNVRDVAGTSTNVVGKLSKGTQVTVLGTSYGWYNISYGNLTGWVSGMYLTLTDTVITTGVVTGNNVNIRNNPSLDAGVVVRVGTGEKVSILSRSGSWYKIRTSGGTTGWVFSEYVSVGDANVSRSDEPKADSSKGDSQQVVDYAKKFLGVGYVYGGSSPKGFDCSGFVQYVYKNFGVTLERVAANQAGQGVWIGKDSLKPGDLVFFDTDGGRNYINHVGIYIGDGNFIHASSGRSTHRVTISDLGSSFYVNAYMTARRVSN